MRIDEIVGELPVGARVKGTILETSEEGDKEYFGTVIDPKLADSGEVDVEGDHGEVGLFIKPDHDDIVMAFTREGDHWRHDAYGGYYEVTKFQVVKTEQSKRGRCPHGVAAGNRCEKCDG